MAINQCHTASMGTQPDREPVLGGRGAVLIEDFCRSTGLERVEVEHLLRTSLGAAALWVDEEMTRPFGIFADMLPSREALSALTLRVSEDYDPEALRGFDMPDDRPDAV